MGANLEVTIEKLVYGGDGLARLTPDESGRGKTLFVPFVLEGERAEVVIEEERKGFARGHAERLISVSPERTEPKCPYFGKCGGCHYQHTNYQQQLQVKQGILRETLLRTAKLDLESEIQVHSGEPWNFRNRTRMKVRTTGEFALGYFRHASHELLAVHECPISSPLINRAISAVWELGENKSINSDVRELQFFANNDDTQLLVEVLIDPRSSPQHQKPFAEALRNLVPETHSIAAIPVGRMTDDDEATEITGGRATVLLGKSSITYQTKTDSYRVSPGSFFQTNRFLTDELVSTALRDFEGHRAIDLYSGVGLFTLPLAKRFDRVTSVESAPSSFNDLLANSPENAKTVQQMTAEFLRRNAALDADFALVDPPRAGLGERTALTLAKTRIQRLAYVSCDPSTLARDLRVFLQSGFHIEQVHLVDLFPQTFHIESIVHLAR